jgi:hypothetical protein
MAVRFAKVRRLPIIIWRLPNSGERATSMTVEEIDQLPGFLTQKINPTKGLANGASITYESTYFNEEENEEDIRIATLQIITTRRGEVVVL